MILRTIWLKECLGDCARAFEEWYNRAVVEMMVRELLGMIVEINIDVLNNMLYTLMVKLGKG